MSDLGYSTTNCLLCLETIGPLILIYYLKVVYWWFIVKSCTKKFKKVRRCWLIKKLDESLRRNLFFSEIIIICIQGYLELLLTAVLNLQVPLESTSGEALALFLAYHSVAVTLFLMPLLSAYIIYNDETMIKSENF